MQVTKRLPTPITDLYVEVRVPTGYKSESTEVNIIDDIQVLSGLFFLAYAMHIFARLSSHLRTRIIRCAESGLLTSVANPRRSHVISGAPIQVSNGAPRPKETFICKC